MKVRGAREVRLGDVWLVIESDDRMYVKTAAGRELGRLTLPCAEGRLKAMLLFLKLAQLDRELIR